MKNQPTAARLTEKQRQYVANKVAGCTNRDAAVAAGYAVGSASAQADKLMAMPSIRAAIKAGSKGAPGVDIKPAALTMPRATYADPMQFLVDTMNHPQLPIAVRVDAAKQLMPYKHARMGEVGKKQTAKEKARDVAGGKRGTFTPKQPPALTVVRNE